MASGVATIPLFSPSASINWTSIASISELALGPLFLGACALCGRRMVVGSSKY